MVQRGKSSRVPVQRGQGHVEAAAAMPRSTRKQMQPGKVGCYSMELKQKGKCTSAPVLRGRSGQVKRLLQHTRAAGKVELWTSTEGSWNHRQRPRRLGH